jgi:Ca2+-binding RTX toxin-like protein
VSVKLYSGSQAAGTPVQTLTGNGPGAGWQATAAALSPGAYTVQASQVDDSGNEGLSAPHTFTVVAPPGGGGSGGGPPPGATNGDDVLNGTPGPDLICGLFGNDTINGLAGNDTLFGDACSKKASIAKALKDGNDRLNGGAGNDKLDGGAGNDSLSGGAGNDKLKGGSGKNSYSAGPGNDSVNAANGVKETVDCGAGKKDSVTADRKDRLRGCEKVHRRGH